MDVVASTTPPIVVSSSTRKESLVPVVEKVSPQVIESPPPPPEKKVSTPGALVAPEKQSVTTGVVQALKADEIIALTNAERVKTGLPPLASAPLLSAIAKAKADDMIAKQYFAHIAPDGTGIATLAEQYNYQFLNIGENLALGDFDTSAEVVTGWMNSPGHRANILNTQFTEIGVAAVQGIRNGKKVWYAVQEFGRPLSACLSPEPLLKEKIAVYQGELTALGTTLKNLKIEIASSTEDQTANTNEYNTIVTTYNTLVASTKTDIAKYNTQAQAFNICAGLE